ncbi:MAG: prepilin-type N-terminal cleavage/methylation domain-containing protein [Halioglobus sp.]|jgi:prepilin-type N-terminal cleavage/methylation domain-containing protein
MIDSAQRGFSLLELLVALFVVVIVTSLVSLNVNTGGQDIQLESKVRSLADISSYALDEAQLSGIDMGLLIELDARGADSLYRYSWWERGRQRWILSAQDSEVFDAGQFPPDVELELELEDLPVTDLTTPPDPNDPIPQIVFYSSGETSPGQIEFRRRQTGDILWILEWDLIGRFSALLRGEPLPEEDDRDSNRF